MRILVIDDDQDILSNIRKLLEEEHYNVETVDDGEKALNKIWDDNYDLILLDVMLPGIDGFTLLNEMRKSEITTPVLMLTAKSGLDDRVNGLNQGADDYLVKPFSVAELLARVRALIRRSKTSSPMLEAGNINLDTVGRQAYKNGKRISLTSKEFSILEFLLHNKGRAVSRFTLAEHVWGDAFDPFSMSNFIDVHMSNLRKKISSADSEHMITTIRGYGYRIDRENT